MDLDTLMSKLSYFRVKDLQYVLTQLGLPKSGRKRVLIDRIAAQWTDKAVAELVEDAYRGIFASNHDIPENEEPSVGADSATSNVRICCPCGTSLCTNSMIQCVDPECQALLHISCVIMPEMPQEESRPVPPKFLCPKCRVKRANPFWVTVSYLISPMRLGGTQDLQLADGSFQLSSSDMNLLQNSEYDIQAFCLLLNDQVLYRVHWPTNSHLIVNGSEIPTVGRPISEMLGRNARDDGALMKEHMHEGLNQISLLAWDPRAFCLAVRIVKRRTVEQVLDLIPKENDDELLKDALARLQSCITGKAGPVNEDDDSDVEVIGGDTLTVNLRCPLSGSRMKIAGRFKLCSHLGCFDLKTFVELNQLSKKWQCPICLRNYCIEDIVIDPYFNRITTLMQEYPEDVDEIEVRLDGSWKAKTNSELPNVALWHLPNGSLCPIENEVTSTYRAPKETYEEDVLKRSSVSIGTKKDFGGSSKVSGKQVDVDIGNHAVRIGSDTSERAKGKEVISLSDS